MSAARPSNRDASSLNTKSILIDRHASDQVRRRGPAALIDSHVEVEGSRNEDGRSLEIEVRCKQSTSLPLAEVGEEYKASQRERSHPDDDSASSISHVDITLIEGSLKANCAEKATGLDLVLTTANRKVGERSSNSSRKASVSALEENDGKQHSERVDGDCRPHSPKRKPTELGSPTAEKMIRAKKRMPEARQ